MFGFCKQEQERGSKHFEDFEKLKRRNEGDPGELPVDPVEPKFTVSTQRSKCLQIYLVASWGIFKFDRLNYVFSQFAAARNEDRQ